VGTTQVVRLAELTGDNYQASDLQSHLFVL
jgi:hypothetical protein